MRCSKIYPLIFCLIYFTLNSSAALSAQTPTQLIAGGYTTNDKYTHPLVAVSYDNGNSFALTAITGLPSEGYRLNNSYSELPFTVTSLSCLSGYCAAVGLYGPGIPFVLNSYDQGMTWSAEQKILNLPEKKIWLRDVKCRNSFCVAVGSHSIILTKNVNTQNWSLVNLPISLWLEKTSCINNNCVAVGRNFGSPIVSKDSGTTWTFANSEKWTANKEESSLKDVACNVGNICIAAGKVNNNLLLLVSKDSGTSWERIKNIAGLPAHDAYELTALSCADSTCVALGKYRDGIEIQPSYLFLLVSQDFGATWSYDSAIPKITYAGDLDAQVYCQSRNCLAIMSSTLLVSNHRGKYWSVVNNITNLPPYVSQLIYRSVRLRGNTATIVGTYGTKEYNYFPLVLTSHDHGRSWKFVSINGLPNDIIHGDLETNWM